MKETTFLAGSAIRISAVLSVDSATCSVTVKDEASRAKITDASMTKIADKVYEYIFQSSTTDEEGEYNAIAKIVTASGTSYEKIQFTLEPQP